MATKLRQKVFYIDGKSSQSIKGVIEGFIIQGPIGLKFYINNQKKYILQTGLTGVFQMNNLENVFVITIAEDSNLEGERVLINYLDKNLEAE